MIHHIIILFGLFYGRYAFDRYGHLPTLMIWSDLCTFFLTLKRYCKGKGKTLASFTTYLFYLSWLVVRVIGCPFVVWLAYKDLMSCLQEYRPALIPALLIHSYLTIMNYKSFYMIVLKATDSSQGNGNKKTS